MDEYPLIVIPETKILEEKFIDELLLYMENGGSLLIIGTDSYEIFRQRFDLFGVNETGDYLISEDGKTWAYSHGGLIMNSFAGISHGFMALQEDIDDGDKHSAAEIMKYGEGKACIILADIGKTYLKRKSHVHRKFIKSILSKLYEPMVILKGSMYIDMTIMEKDGRVMINLVNTAGSHDDQDVYTIDEIPPIGPVTLKIQYESKPKKVRLEPSGTKLETVWDARGKLLTVRIPKIDIHEILLID
jgi:hypothetical protein